MDKKVWYVMGVSKGLGLALINRLLREGHRVAAVTGASLPLISGAVQAHPFFLLLTADLSDEQSVADSMRRTCEVFGRIDVVVNNAGYGLGAPIDHTITVIQKAMPRLRAQRSGHIINIGPITGVTRGSLQGYAFYEAARQATIDLTTTLADDVASLGIQVTAVLADQFHTGFVDKKPSRVPTWHVSIDGRQPVDPEKAAATLLRIAMADEPPTLVYLTSNAYKVASEKMILFGRPHSDLRLFTGLVNAALTDCQLMVASEMNSAMSPENRNTLHPIEVR
jgi:NAD(P)-dependent dehydrogenase (short-subunit alcohol dehydrogenase family)